MSWQHLSYKHRSLTLTYRFAVPKFNKGHGESLTLTRSIQKVKLEMSKHPGIFYWDIIQAICDIWTVSHLRNYLAVICAPRSHDQIFFWRSIFAWRCMVYRLRPCRGSRWNFYRCYVREVGRRGWWWLLLYCQCWRWQWWWRMRWRLHLSKIGGMWGMWIFNYLLQREWWSWCPSTFQGN